jgi:hypothetical protein
MEQVSVVTIYSVNKRRVAPWKLKWRGRVYTVKEVPLHYTVRDGETLHHKFSVTDGNMAFLLDYNTLNMHWTLEKTIDMHAAS